MLNGFVYTMRTFERKGMTPVWITDKRGGKKLAEGIMTFRQHVPINEIHTNSIPDIYTKASGFKNTEEWIEEFAKLHEENPLAVNIYIYHVMLYFPEIHKPKKKSWLNEEITYPERGWKKKEIAMVTA